jgi:hypothetical protein
MNAKVNLLKSLLIFIALTGYLPFLQSQNNGMPAGMPPGMKVPGYVILSSGDTLQGELKWALKYVENNPVEIKFTAENGASKDLNASEIKGFGQNTGFLPEPEHYVSLPSLKKGVPVFMNRLIDGRITVYQNRSSIGITTSKTVDKVEGKLRIDGVHFTWIPGDGLYLDLSLAKDYRIIEYNKHFTSYFVSKAGNPLVKVTKDEYDSYFRTWFGDCQAIDDEIRKNPDLKSFKNFMIIAEVYNKMCK